MIKNIITILLIAAGISCTTNSEPVSVFTDYETEVEAKVEQLLSSLTLEEKVGQMAQLTLDGLAIEKTYSNSDQLELDPNKLEKAFKKYKIGSVLNTADRYPMSTEYWNKIINQIQEIAIKETNIPMLYGIDAIHGTSYTVDATFFPQQIGLAATWNRELIEQVGEITSYETRASGIPWTFSPVLGIGIDPRWPRFWETFGEDPYLSSELGVAMTIGYQGNLEDGYLEETKSIASAKHFLGYSYPRSGKDRTSAWIPDHYLREYFVPPFKAAIAAGVQTIMINSSDINGTPVHANKAILTDLLKEELQFKGFAVTDWADIIMLHERHKVASTQKEAVKIAINAGVDMSMLPEDLSFCDHLIELVNEGEVSQARIDDAVRRILRVKVKAGLFNETKKVDYPKFNSAEFNIVAYNAALESITLLKNKNKILPLTKTQKILVVGPNANTMRPLNGGWSYSWQGDNYKQFTSDYNTIYEAIKLKSGDENVTLLEGVAYEEGTFDPQHEDHIIDFKNIKEKAQQADVVILALGENSYTETPGDLDDLRLSQNQIDLAKEVFKYAKKTVLVLNEGRPRIIQELVANSDAIVHTYLPGNYGADALATLLYGDHNFSGKLPFTYPKYVNSLDPYYHKHADEVGLNTDDPKIRLLPEFNFGEGISYTSYNYSNLVASLGESTNTIKLTVDVKNTGQTTGKEVVMLFVSDLYASITPDVKRLRGFDKIELAPNETKTVSFIISDTDLAFETVSQGRIIEPGDFKFKISNLDVVVNYTTEGSWQIKTN